MPDQYEGQLTDPKWETGSVNVDSLKEVLLTLSSQYPFLDETSRRAFDAQIHGLDSAGDPHKTEEEVAVDEKDAEIAALKAQLAEAEAARQAGQ